MEATLLGTSTAIGMPAPACGCDYCKTIERTRPSLLIETERNTFLFDVSPDIRQQLHRANIQKIDSIFLTHHHHDHASGLREINHITTKKEKHFLNQAQIPESNKDWYDRPVSLYLSPQTKTYIENESGYLFTASNYQVNNLEETDYTFDNITVTPLSLNHCEGYRGFKITDEEKTVVYIPDFGQLEKDYSFASVDVLIVDGSSFLGYDIHGELDGFKSVVETIDAEEIVLVNVSEHLAQVSTETLKNKGASFGAVVGEEQMKIL